MKRTLYIIIIALLSCLTAEANDKQAHADSLFNYVRTNFNTLAPEEQTAILDSLETVAAAAGSTRYQAYAKAKRVEGLYSDFENDDFFTVADEAEQYARTTGNTTYLFFVMQVVAQRLGDQGQYARAILKGRQMYDEAHALGQPQQMVRAATAIARAYDSLGVLSETITYYNEALAQLDAVGNSADIQYAEIYREITTAYFFKEDWDAAQASNRLMRSKTDESIAADNQLNLDQNYFLADYFDGFIATKREQADSARHYLNLAREKYNEAWSPIFGIYIKHLEATVYFLEGEYARSATIQKEIIDFLNQYGLKSSLPTYLADYAGSLVHLHRPEEAAEAALSAYRLRDESSKKDVLYQISELRTLYEFDKVELQAQKDKIALQSTRNLLAAAVIIVLLLIVTLVIYIIYSRREVARVRSLMEATSRNEVFMRETTHPGEVSVPQEEPGSNIVTALYAIIVEFMHNSQAYTNPNLTRKDVAVALNSNQTYIYKAIKENTGLTFNEYLFYLRLEHARNLLAEPESTATIEGIAEASGYRSRKTFHLHFRNRYGITPDECRSEK